MKILEFLKKRKSSLKQLGGSLGLLALAGCIGIGLGLYKTNGTKKYAVEAYDYYKESNWVALYKYTELKDDSFINEYFFEQLANEKYGQVDEGTLKLGDIEKNGNKADVNCYYKDSQGKKVDCSFTMIKKPNKNYLFFNEWKLDISELIAEKCKVVAPQGVALYVDGIELTVDNSRVGYNSVTGLLEYEIPRIFKGDHTVIAKQDMLNPTETVISWNENSCEYIVDTSAFTLVEGVQTYVKSCTENIVQLMYKNIFEETLLTGLESYILNDAAAKASFTATYDKMLAAIQPDDGSTLNSISITGFDNHKIEYVYPDTIKVSIDFACTFKARGPRNVSSGAREKYEGEARSTITMEYTYDGTQWMCSTLNMDCIDYSKKETEEKK